MTGVLSQLNVFLNKTLDFTNMEVFDFEQFESFTEVFGESLGRHLWAKFGTHHYQGVGNPGNKHVVYDNFKTSLSGDSRKMIDDHNSLVRKGNF